MEIALYLLYSGFILKILFELIKNQFIIIYQSVYNHETQMNFCDAK